MLDELNDQKIEIKQSNKCGYERFRFLISVSKTGIFPKKVKKNNVITIRYHASS